MSYREIAKTLIRYGAALAKERLGAEKKYCIRGGYVHGRDYNYFDDTPFKDEYQKEVYVRALEIASQSKLRTIYDVGCGSGYKLLKYFGEYETIGFDVSNTVAHLRKEYPNRKWVDASIDAKDYVAADMVICSDVIEHVVDPDKLIKSLIEMSNKWLVISTPDRLREYPLLSSYRLGPPHTNVHIREWTFSEFRQYIEHFVDVHEHFHSNPDHATQMIVATIRSRR